MSGSISVVVVDDDAVVRAGLQAILNGQEDIDVVATGADGEAALELVAELRPDVLLLDLRMPRRDGLSTLVELVRRGSLRDGRSRALILTTFDTDDLVDRALAAGAAGFVLKNSSHEELAAAVRAAAAGHTVLSPSLTGRIVHAHLAERQAAADDDPAALDVLTDREREVLALIAEGLSNHEIGVRLHVSMNTVKTHVSRVLAKTHSTSRVHAAVLARGLRRR